MAEQEAVVVDEGIEEMQRNVEALKSIEGTIDANEDEQSVDDNDEVEDDYSTSELKAMEMGWNPDKDNIPEGKEWISAGEFIRNDKFFSEIRKLKRDNQSTKRDFEVLKEHHKKVQTMERDKLLTQLKHQKKIALEEDDHDTVIEIDEQMMDIKSTPAVDEIDVQAASNEVFLDWVESNSWYEQDEDMRQTADELGAAYSMRTGGKASQDDMFKYVEGRIKKLYPDNFSAEQKPTRRRAAPTVEAATPASRKRASKAPKFTAKDLNSDQRTVMKRFVSQGVLTESEYINELVSIGELS